MADPHVIAASGRLNDVTVNGTVKPGDVLYHDGTGWVQADADSNATYGEYISLGHGDTTLRTKISIAKRAVIEDTDAPYTRAANHWLHTTPGNPSSTRPTGSDDIEQKIGEAVSTSLLDIEVPWPRHVQVPIIHSTTGSGETATALDTGAVAGDALNDSTEASYQNFMIPGGFVAWLASRCWAAVETDVNFDYTVSVTSAEDGEAHDVEASSPDAGATANAVDQAPYDVGALDVSTSLDLAGISEPGKFAGLKFLRGTSGTDEVLFLGTELIAEVVG